MSDQRAPRRATSARRSMPDSAFVDLDDVDRQLLNLLGIDGRASYASLAASVSLSAPAVRLRVQRLIEERVLQVVGVADPAMLGFPVQAMVGINTHGDLRVVADQIATIENVIYLVLAAGEHDLLAEVVAATSDELLEVVNDRIRAVPGVSATRVWQYYGIHTHRFTVEGHESLLDAATPQAVDLTSAEN